MSDLVWRWSVRGTGRVLTLRWWWNSPLRGLWYWLRGKSVWFECRLRTVHRENGFCYCPTGSTSEVRLAAFGCGLWLWLSRDLTKRPCVCETIVSEALEAAK